MSTIPKINVEFMGIKRFLDVTKQARENLAGKPDDYNIQETPVKREAADGSIGSIFITTKRENKEKLGEGIIKITDGDPIEVEEELIPLPIQGGLKHLIGLTLCAGSNSLNDDILGVARRFES